MVGRTPEGVITNRKALQSEIDFIFGTHGISTLQKIREHRVTKRVLIRLKLDATAREAMELTTEVPLTPDSWIQKKGKLDQETIPNTMKEWYGASQICN